jgi:hypothetical protein
MSATDSWLEDVLVVLQPGPEHDVIVPDHQTPLCRRRLVGQQDALPGIGQVQDAQIGRINPLLEHRSRQPPDVLLTE